MKYKLSKNIGKTRTHVKALLEELNEIASREPEPKEFYFYLEHHARDWIASAT